MISMFVCRDGTVAAGEFCVRQPLAAPAQKGDATPRAPAPPKTEVRKHRRCGITAGAARPFIPCVTFTSWRGGQQKSRQQRHPGLASHHPCCFRRQIVCGRLNIPDKGCFLLVIFEEFSFQFCTNVGRVSTNSTNRIFGLARGQIRLAAPPSLERLEWDASRLAQTYNGVVGCRAATSRCQRWPWRWSMDFFSSLES